MVELQNPSCLYLALREHEGHSHIPTRDKGKPLLRVSGRAHCILTVLTQIQILSCFFKEFCAQRIICAQ